MVEADATPAILGRERETALLGSALDDAMRRRGRLVLISGEPGIGKSTLAAAVAQRAAGMGLRVSSVRAPETRGAPPYWVWGETLHHDVTWQGHTAEAMPDAVLARILPELRGGRRMAAAGPLGEGDAERFRLADAIAGTLVRSALDGCRVVVLDDIHAADAPSLDVLAHVASRLAAAALLVVATHRDAPDEVTPALQTVLARVSREEGTVRIPLQGLDTVAVRRQLEAITARDVDVETAAAVRARTGGNPFFTAEVARLLATRDGAAGPGAPVAVPPRVRDVITWRLGRLPPDTRAVLDAAALIGRELAVDLLAAACGVPPHAVLAALEPAMSAALVGRGDGGRGAEGHGADERDGRPAGGAGTGGSPGRLHFVHALVAETIAGSLSLARAAELHERVATAIETRRAGTLDAWLPALALHWSLATPTDHASRRTVEMARRAAEQAEARLAFADAVPLWSTALDAADRAGSDAGTRASLELGIARSRFRSGDVAGAVEACVDAARHAETAGLADLQAVAALVVEGVTEPQSAAQLVALAERALARLEGGEPALRARLHAQIGQLIHRLPAAPTERERTETALAVELAETSGDVQALQAALRAEQLVLSGPDGVDRRLHNAGRMVGIGRTSGDAWAELWGRLWSVDALLQLGRLADAELELGGLDRVVARVGWPVARWHALRARAGILQVRGRFDEALSVANDALEQVSATGITEADVMHAAFLEAHADLVGAVAAEEEARRRLREWAAGHEPGAAIWAIVGMVRAGELDEARRLYARMPPVDRWTPPPYALSVALRVRLVTAIRLELHDEVARLLDRFAPYARWHVAFGSGAFLSFGSGYLYTGMAAAFLGDAGRAVTEITRALHENTRCGAHALAVVARSELAEALVQRSDGTDLDTARRHATAALREAQRLGMQPVAERASLLLRGLPRRRLRSDRLTARELEVARLVAEGMTNRQVAVRLRISERTVENHLGHVFAKLGAGGRAQVAAWVASRPPEG